MGCNFCKKKGYKSINYLAPEEKEIQIKDYSSEKDKNLEIFKTKLNFFGFVQLVEYVNLLEEFTMETSAVITDEPMRINFNNKDTFLDQPMSLEEFQSFIENKIFNLEDINEILANNEKNATIFKKICTEVYQALELKLKESYINDSDLINKRNLIAIGILFCNCENIEKIKLIFDIFKKEKEIEKEEEKEKKYEICKDDKLNKFLLTLFLISSYCLITARQNISEPDLGIEKISEEDINMLELKDCQNLVELFNESFFKSESYNWAQFRKKFEDEDNGFGWIISSKGIRRKLEENKK